MLVNDLACVDDVSPAIVPTKVDKYSHDVVNAMIDFFVIQLPRSLLEQAKTFTELSD